MIKPALINKNSGKHGATALTGVIGALLFFTTFFFAISVGSVGFSFSDTLRVLSNYLLGVGDTSDIPENLITIIINVRLPRVILAAL